MTHFFAKKQFHPMTAQSNKVCGCAEQLKYLARHARQERAEFQMRAELRPKKCIKTAHYTEVVSDQNSEGPPEPE